MWLSPGVFLLRCRVNVSAAGGPVSSQRSVSQDDQADESFNRRAALLKCLSVIMCCSPVCEKQALFALFQSYKENNVDEKLILKVTGSGTGEGGVLSHTGHFELKKKKPDDS